MMRLVGILVAAAGLACGQQAMTLSQAVQSALRNYPSIRVSQEQMNAAVARIRLARTAYLPRVDGVAQVNRATRNNLLGLLLPTSGILPSISGPVLGTNNLDTAWGSAVGFLVTWEPFDFGLRKANVVAAEADRAQAQAAVKRSQFEVAVQAADAYLTLLAAQETARAARAGVERTQVVARNLHALVNAELRPGADASRADAELAAARTQVIQAEQAIAVARATVAQFTGIGVEQVAAAGPKLLTLPPEAPIAALRPEQNPIVAEQNATAEQAQAQLRALERTYFPKFALQGSAYARGTGTETNGRLLGGLNGLGPTVQDYAVGFTVTFPAMDRPAIQAREAEQNAILRAEQARVQLLVTDLRAQWNRAVADVDGARKVAANTPVQVTAARTAYRQATARYEAGLGTIDEVAQAQRLTTQAEIDDALAGLSVWRGLLEIAVAAGDIQPFVAEAGQ